MLRGVVVFLVCAVSANPVIQRDVIDTTTPTPTVITPDSSTKCSSSTSSQWLHICDTTLFWPTSTNYYYGPTDGPEASVVYCNAAWIEYNQRVTELESLGPTTTFPSYESSLTSTGACRTSISGEQWDDPHFGPLTTLCDGAPRALGPRELVTAYFPGTGPCSSFSQTWTGTTSLYYTPAEDPPTCSLNTEECIAVWKTYSSLSSEWRSSVTTVTPGDTNSPIRPSACPSSPRNYTVEDPCTNCHYLPDTATVFYWPVSTTNGDLCSGGGSTVPATPTGDGPNTAIIDGNTFVSPSIYISFTSIYARSNMRAHPGGPCGEDHVDAIVSVDPSEVSSYRYHRNAKYPIIGTKYPFDFAEYQPHEVGNYTQPLIPWAQYLGGSQCPIGASTCTMIRDDYMPWMEIPDAMTQIDPRWSMCDRDWYIPPVTLVPLGVEEWSKPTDVADAGVAAAVAALPESGVAAPTPEATVW